MNGSFMLGGGKVKMGDLTDIHPFKIFILILKKIKEINIAYYYAY